MKNDNTEVKRQKLEIGKKRSRMISAFAEMPGLSHYPDRDNPFDHKKSEVLQWAMKQPLLWEWLWDKLKAMGVIEFNPADKKWYGINTKRPTEAEVEKNLDEAANQKPRQKSESKPKPARVQPPSPIAPDVRTDTLEEPEINTLLRRSKWHVELEDLKPVLGDMPMSQRLALLLQTFKITPEKLASEIPGEPYINMMTISMILAGDVDGSPLDDDMATGLDKVCFVEAGTFKKLDVRWRQLQRANGV